MKICVGDFVSYEWSTNLSFHGIVISVSETTELQKRQGILYSFELLEENEKRFWYDVWKGEEDKLVVHSHFCYESTLHR